MLSTSIFRRLKIAGFVANLFIATAVWFIIGFEVQAEPLKDLNLYNIKLENLSDFSEFYTKSFNGKTSIWVLFQPDCGSCKAQLKELSCVSSDIEKIALGIGGSRERLVKELRFVTKGQKRLRASKELENYLKVEGTPTILLVGAQGEIQKRLMGLSTCEQLKKMINSVKM